MNFNMGFPLCLEFTIKLLVFKDFTAVGILGSGADGLDGLLISVFLDALSDKERLEAELLVRGGNKFVDGFTDIDGTSCRELEVDCSSVLMDLSRSRASVTLPSFFIC